MSNQTNIKHYKLSSHKDEPAMQFGNVAFFNQDVPDEEATLSELNVEENTTEENTLDAQLKEAAKIILREDDNVSDTQDHDDETLAHAFVGPMPASLLSPTDSADQADIHLVAQENHLAHLDHDDADDNDIEVGSEFEDDMVLEAVSEVSILTESDDLDADEDEVVDQETTTEESFAENVLDEAPVDLSAIELTQAEGIDHQTLVSEQEHPDHDEIDNATLPKIGKVGRLLLGLGKITAEDTKKILSEQKKNGLLFGDAALKLGLINQSDIQQVVALQFNYNYLQAGQGNFHDDLISVYTPFIKKAEAYRALRSQLMMKWFKKGHRVLAIGSANRQEGVSYLTANLGVVFAQLGARTLIIEANMRTPRQHAIFNPYDNVGLSDVLVGRANTEEAIKDVLNIPDLSLLTAGTIPPNPQELLGRTSFNILIKSLKDHYDVILIDTPAATESADAQSAFELAQGVLFVSRLDHTKHEDVLNVTNQIEMSEAILVGAVMNEF